MRLGDLLIAAGTITQEELEKGLALQKEQKGRLGEVLISNGIITEQQLIEALQMQLGIEFVDLTKINIPTELAQVVPKNIAKQYTVVPIRVVKDAPQGGPGPRDQGRHRAQHPDPLRQRGCRPRH